MRLVYNAVVIGWFVPLYDLQRRLLNDSPQVNHLVKQTVYSKQTTLDFRNPGP